MNKKSMRKLPKILSILFLIIFVVLILLFALRGKAGNPTSKELFSPAWMENGPLELSPERGRYALLYSVVEDKSLIFDLSIARIATPDLGIANGNYVSLFAPLVSFVMIPGYILGKTIGLAQVGGFAAISLFALFNVFLLRAIAIRLGANSLAATIASLVFVLGSPAFTYAVALYQHHISTFLILSSIYTLLKWKNWVSLSLVWLLFAASIPVDYPNLILMLPIALYATTRIFWVESENSSNKLKIRLFNLLTPVAVVIPLVFYMWFSQGSYGKPLRLSGTIESVRAIDAQGRPTAPRLVVNNPILKEKEKKEKSAVGFFKTRNLVNGFYTHFISPDRGIIYYAPVMLFGIVGMLFAITKKVKMNPVLIGIVGSNILLYSMWGDPWGGWAFGSRYLIPSYAILSIFIALFLTYLRRRLWFLVIFILVAFYSIAVNTLGAITTSAVPPQVEVLELERFSGFVQKYTFERNWDFLVAGNSKSFVYQTFLKDYLTPVQFYQILTISIVIVVGGILIYYGLISQKEGHENV